MCEQSVAESLKAEGWEVLSSGWPDFLCWRSRLDGTHEVMAVEVKGPGDFFRAPQLLNHAVLAGAGLPVYVAKNPDLSTMHFSPVFGMAQRIEGYKPGRHYLTTAEVCEVLALDAKSAICLFAPEAEVLYGGVPMRVPALVLNRVVARLSVRTK